MFLDAFFAYFVVISTCSYVVTELKILVQVIVLLRLFSYHTVELFVPTRKAIRLV